MEAIAAIGELVAAIGTAAGALVQLTLESLGFAVGHLSDDDKSSRGITWQRVVVALTPLCLLLIGIPALWWCLSRPARVRRARMETATVQMGEMLADAVREDKKIVWPPATPRHRTDPWGIPYRFDQTEGEFTRKLIVRCSGPDRQQDTTDDIVEQRNALLPKGKLAENALRILIEQATKSSSNDAE